jgi:hypothetical protein
MTSRISCFILNLRYFARNNIKLTTTNNIVMPATVNVRPFTPEAIKRIASVIAPMIWSIPKTMRKTAQRRCVCRFASLIL